MKVDTKIQAETRARVLAWAEELFGANAAHTNDGLGARVHFGSSFVELSVSAVGDTEAVVIARAPVVTGSAINADLLRYLLRKNCDTRFGAFGVDDTGEIELRYAIVGSTCQKAELRAALQYLMLAADLADDEIIARWGGVRARDLGHPAPGG